MANNFTVEKQRRFGGPNGMQFLLTEGILVIDTTATGGATPDDLSAALFKLTKIVACLAITNDGETAIFVGAPDYTGDSLLIQGITSATDVITVGTGDLPNDTYRVKLIGT